MFDYEITGYKVEWKEIGSVVSFEREFGTEEEAVAFIRENITKWWMDWRILKIMVAIGDIE